MRKRIELVFGVRYTTLGRPDLPAERETFSGSKVLGGQKNYSQL